MVSPRNILLVALLLLTSLGGCATRSQPHLPATLTPELHDDHATMDDGYRLPVQSWHPDSPTRAVVLALHGFNDYRNAFQRAGRLFAAQGISTYAYDQRGFGETDYRGLWSGHERMCADLHAMLTLIRERHPDVPLFLLGESMGGAVAITALARRPMPVDGVVLVAPAVWSRDMMPWYQRAGLWLALRLFPGWTPTGESLGRMPSDNIEMLRKLAADPLVIKQTRIDTVAGLVELMDAALASVPALRHRTLLLYGANDQIIPPQPTCRLLRKLPAATAEDWQVAWYPDGYHMLLRDLQGEQVVTDIAHWMLTPGPLPSGSTVPPDEWGSRICL